MRHESQDSDAKAAFVKAKVERELYARVPKDVVDCILEVDYAKYQPYVLNDDTLWARVNKAAYGAGDAARLWCMLAKNLTMAL